MILLQKKKVYLVVSKKVNIIDLTIEDESDIDDESNCECIIVSNNKIDIG